MSIMRENLTYQHLRYMLHAQIELTIHPKAFALPRISALT